MNTAGELDEQFTAVLRKSPEKGGWTDLVRADIRKAISKETGDTVTVRLEERIEG